MMSGTTPSHHWRQPAEEYKNRKPPPDHSYGDQSLLGQMRSSSPDSYQLESNFHAFGVPQTSLGASMPIMTNYNEDSVCPYSPHSSKSTPYQRQYTNLYADSSLTDHHEYRQGSRKPPPLSATSLYFNDTTEQCENEESLSSLHSPWALPHSLGNGKTNGRPSASMVRMDSEASLDSTIRQAQLTMERFHKSQMLQQQKQAQEPRPQIESCPPPKPPDLVFQEPKIIMRCSDRYKQEKSDRVPDVQHGTLVRDQKRTLALPVDRHVVLCTNCQRPLAVHKKALAVKCPACKMIGPAIGTAKSTRAK